MNFLLFNFIDFCWILFFCCDQKKVRDLKTCFIKERTHHEGWKHNNRCCCLLLRQRKILKTKKVLRKSINYHPTDIFFVSTWFLPSFYKFTFLIRPSIRPVHHQLKPKLKLKDPLNVSLKNLEENPRRL